METNSAIVSNRTPYTCIMPLLAKNEKKSPPELLDFDVLDSFFGEDFLDDFWFTLAWLVIMDLPDWVREGF